MRYKNKSWSEIKKKPITTVFQSEAFQKKSKKKTTRKESNGEKKKKSAGEEKKKKTKKSSRAVKEERDELEDFLNSSGTGPAVDAAYEAFQHLIEQIVAPGNDTVNWTDDADAESEEFDLDKVLLGYEEL